MNDVFKLVGGLAKLAFALVAVAVCGVVAAVRGIVGAAGGRGTRTTPVRGHGATPPPLPTEPHWVRRRALPKPPSIPEYHAAGVSPDVCTLCAKRIPERNREWRFMVLDGRPAVICPACWRKHVTNNTDAAAAAFEARISTRVWNAPRVDRSEYT